MPKKDKVVLDAIPELDEKLEELVSQVSSPEAPTTYNPKAPSASSEEKKEELMKASEDGYISTTTSHIKRAASKTLNKLYTTYLSKRKKEADLFLTDLIIKQFTGTLGSLGAIDSPENLADELKTNVLLRKDLENIVGIISPYIPIIGIVTGLVATGKHIYMKRAPNKSDSSNDQAIRTPLDETEKSS